MCVPLCSQDLRDPFLFGISLIWQPLRVWLSFIEMSLELDAWKPESEGHSSTSGLWDRRSGVFRIIWPLEPTTLRAVPNKPVLQRSWAHRPGVGNDNVAAMVLMIVEEGGDICYKF